jgi:lysozyme
MATTIKARFVALVGLPVAMALATLIPRDEGMVLKTYRDPVGILTSCMGHTGPELKLGQTYTREQCDQQMFADLLKHTDPVVQCMGTTVWNRTPPYQRVAIVDFAYNKGVTAFCTSTYKAKLVARDPLACQEPLRWTNVTLSGRKVSCYVRSNNCYGLVLRAERNQRMCSGDMSDLGLDIDFTLTGELP